MAGPVKKRTFTTEYVHAHVRVRKLPLLHVLSLFTLDLESVLRSPPPRCSSSFMKTTMRNTSVALSLSESMDKLASSATLGFS